MLVTVLTTVLIILRKKRVFFLPCSRDYGRGGEGRCSFKRGAWDIPRTIVNDGELSLRRT